MAVRLYTVDCAVHGPMVRDLPGAGFRCADETCGARLDDEDVHRLVTGSPQDQPGPVPIVVT